MSSTEHHIENNILKSLLNDSLNYFAQTDRIYDFIDTITANLLKKTKAKEQLDLLNVGKEFKLIDLNQVYASTKFEEVRQYITDNYLDEIDQDVIDQRNEENGI